MMTATKPDTRFGTLTNTGESIAWNVVVPFPSSPPGHPEFQGIELRGSAALFDWDKLADAVEAWRDFGVEECTLVAFAHYPGNVEKCSEFKASKNGGEWTAWGMK